jgi:hypothetical protein
LTPHASLRPILGSGDRPHGRCHGTGSLVGVGVRRLALVVVPRASPFLWPGFAVCVSKKGSVCGCVNPGSIMKLLSLSRKQYDEPRRSARAGFLKTSDPVSFPG